MRYGSIRYVNNLPIDHGLLTGAVPQPDRMAVLEGTPAELNRALLAGDVAVSAVSSALLTDPTLDLQILPEAAIASHGPVDSVLLVSKRPFQELDGRPLAVTDESASGALLLRILLEKDLGVRPHYQHMPSDLDTMLEAADAALLIGDDALRLSAERQDALAPYEVLDLGEAWRAYTGLPMVYAVWVTQQTTRAADPAGLDALRRALDASRRWGADHLDAILDEAQRRTQVPRNVLQTYYGRLTHSLGVLEAQGLRRFLQEAAELEQRPPPVVEVPTVEVVS